MAHSDDRELLTGGNVAAEVWRIGDAVRRPAGTWTPTIHALLAHLERVGFNGAPRVLGFDEESREMLEFVPGVVPWPERHREYLGTHEAMHRVGALLRSYHDAVDTFAPPVGATWREPERALDARPFVDGRGEIVCHNDPAAWNLVVGPQRWAFIDWDFAGPRPFIWDVAYGVIGLVPLRPNMAPFGWSDDFSFIPRLRAFVDGYRLKHADRERLLEVVIARIHSMYEHMRRNAEVGVQPWASQWDQGHGAAWSEALTFATVRKAGWNREFLR